MPEHNFQYKMQHWSLESIFKTVWINHNSNKKTHIYLIPYVCNRTLFNSLQFTFKKIFLNKRLYRFVAYQITLCLVPFPSKLVSYSSRNCSLKAQLKAIFRRLRFWSEIDAKQELSRIFKDSVDSSNRPIWTLKVSNEALFNGL